MFPVSCYEICYRYFFVPEQEPLNAWQVNLDVHEAVLHVNFVTQFTVEHATVLQKNLSPEEQGEYADPDPASQAFVLHSRYVDTHVVVNDIIPSSEGSNPRTLFGSKIHRKSIIFFTPTDLLFDFHYI
jgi:hypothetical protein